MVLNVPQLQTLFNLNRKLSSFPVTLTSFHAAPIIARFNSFILCFVLISFVLIYFICGFIEDFFWHSYTVLIYFFCSFNLSAFEKHFKLPLCMKYGLQTHLPCLQPKRYRNKLPLWFYSSLMPLISLLLLHVATFVPPLDTKNLELWVLQHKIKP